VVIFAKEEEQRRARAKQRIQPQQQRNDVVRLLAMFPTSDVRGSR
jgi:hypothetical protein